MEHRTADARRFAESRITTWFKSTATSTQLPLFMLWRDVRQGDLCCGNPPLISGWLDMLITPFSFEGNSSLTEGSQRTKENSRAER